MKDKWFQAYIAGVHTTVFGLKPPRDKMVVESTVELSPSELQGTHIHHNMNLSGPLVWAKEIRPVRRRWTCQGSLRRR